MKPTAILTGDMHLRDNNPVSRCDNYVEDMWEAVRFVVELSCKYDCPILDSGDMLNKWRTSPELIYDCVNNIPKDIVITIPGNHDLPNHNIQDLHKSGLGVLSLTNIRVLVNEWYSHSYKFKVYGRAYGCKISEEARTIKDTGTKTVLLTHEMVWNDKPVYPGLTDKSKAINVLKKYPEFDLVVTGHNHQSFTVEHKGRLLVNCGSLRRMFADQIDFKPRVWLWYAENNTVEPIYLPTKENVFDTTNLVERKETQKKKDELIVRLSKEDEEIDLNFKKNVEQHISTHRIRSRTKSFVLESLE